MNKFFALSWLCLLASLPLLQAGQTFTYPSDSPIFEITYPESWEIEQEEQVVTANSSSGALSSVLMAVAGEDLESAVDGAKQGLNEVFEDFSLGEPREDEINGLPALMFEGKGKGIDGASVDIGGTIFTPDGETYFMLFVFAAGDLSDDDMGEMVGILQSIKGR